MMEEEGLHSWVDRKVCNGRYGMDFYVPSRSDFEDESSDAARHLLINRITKDSWAYAAGLRRGDHIVAVSTDGPVEPDVLPARMLELLATSESETLLSLSDRKSVV